MRLAGIQKRNMIVQLQKDQCRAWTGLAKPIGFGELLYLPPKAFNSDDLGLNKSCSHMEWTFVFYMQGQSNMGPQVV